MNLANLTGWVFDLDGVIWAGRELLPGAAELVAALRRANRRVVFLTNNSTSTRAMLLERLASHGIPAEPREVVCTVDTAAEILWQRFGPVRVLAMGIDGLAQSMEAAGHTVVTEAAEAEAVVVGLDPALNFDRLTTICRAVARGIPYFTLNVDARRPAEGGAWIPGLGALVAAVEYVTGRYPEVIGKPSPLLFETALRHLETDPSASVMVGDNPHTDIAGGLSMGLWTILVGDAHGGPQPHLRVANLAELLDLWQAQLSPC